MNGNSDALPCDLAPRLIDFDGVPTIALPLGKRRWLLRCVGVTPRWTLVFGDGRIVDLGGSTAPVSEPVVTSLAEDCGVDVETVLIWIARTKDKADELSACLQANLSIEL